MADLLPTITELRETSLAIACALAGVIVLRAFYGAFSSEWPQSYFGGSRSVDPVISRTPLRYLAFRTLPLFVAAYSAGVASDRLGSSRSITVLCVWVGYTFVVSLPGIGNAIAGGSPRLGLATYRVMGLLGTAVITVVALALGNRLDSFVPHGKDVAFAFWIAAATLATAHWGRSLMAQHHDAHVLLQRARREVNQELLIPLAGRSGYPTAALLALAFAEHINRPRWVRNLERVSLRRGGTYGIMQMASPRPLTDAESVTLFMSRLSNYPEIHDTHETRDFFLHHNPDETFADLAEQFYWILRDEFVVNDVDLTDEGAELEAERGARRASSRLSRGRLSVGVLAVLWALASFLRGRWWRNSRHP